MSKRTKVIKLVAILLPTIFTVIVGVILNYLTHPVWNLRSNSFWQYTIGVAAINGILFWSSYRIFDKRYKNTYACVWAIVGVVGALAELVIIGALLGLLNS